MCPVFYLPYILPVMYVSCRIASWLVTTLHSSTKTDITRRHYMATRHEWLSGHKVRPLVLGEMMMKIKGRRGGKRTTNEEEQDEGVREGAHLADQYA